MEAGDQSSTLIRDVRPLSDMGHPVWDAIVTAAQLYELRQTGKLAIDPERQRGKDSVTGAEVIKKAKVEQWTEDLLENKWVCGQLSWNLRTEDCEVTVKDGDLGFDGQATIPDSGHRHRTIFNAVESVERGSSFDPSQPFSLRIWNVSKHLEGEIFYKMNQESDKADATRSKWLAQKSPAQGLARQVVRMSHHLTDRNVEVVRNSLSKKNPRLCAFNTVSLGFEFAWEDITEAQIDELCAWFLTYWDALVEVLPDLRQLPLPERQKARETLVGSAVTIQGYIRVGRVIHNRKINFDVLSKLNDKHTEPGGSNWDFFAIDNPLWQRIGVVSPSVTKRGETTLRTRNSHQTRRAMEAALLSHLDLGPEPEVDE